MEKATNSIVDERKEHMVSLSGDTKPVFRTAHFIKTSEKTTNGSSPPSSLPFPCQSKFENSILTAKKIRLRNWVSQQKNWTDWVEKMEVLHGTTWKKVGIFEAVKCSTLNIYRHSEIFTPFVEKWCPDTNTFVFPWGEASITLEDMLILGGYSVLGSKVYRGFEAKQELRDVYKRLKHRRSELFRSRSKKPAYGVWMKMFKDKDLDIEHEAFLAFWLSRFVFPTSSEVIIEHSLSIAVHLAVGTRIALAPAVLASIYRDLSKVKRAVVGGVGAEVNVWAPFVLVQVWVWERFVNFRPMPGSVSEGEPRLSRWCNMKGPNLGIEQLRLDLDSAGEYFRWRPYALLVQNMVLPRFYRDKDEWVLVNDDSDEDLMSFVLCLMPSELLGVEDRIEKYSPHRVAMQFGLDQDIPDFVSQCNTSPKFAWRNYNKPVTNMNLYIPSRASEPDVTVQYLDWWKEFSFSCKKPFKSPEPKGTTAMQLERPMDDFGARDYDNGDMILPGFQRKLHQTSEGESSDEDEMSIAEFLRMQRKKDSCGSSCVGICKKDNEVSKILSQGINDTDIRRRESSVEPFERDIQNIVASEHSKEDMDNIATRTSTPSLEIIERYAQNFSDTGQPKVCLKEEHCSRGSIFDEGETVNEIVGESSECLKLWVLELDIKNQIRDLEREVAILKAARGL